MERGTHEQAFVRLRSIRGHWFVDPSLRDRLVADAEEAGTSLTSQIVKILAERYDVQVETHVRTSSKQEKADMLNFAMPAELAAVIDSSRVARRPRRSVPDEIRHALSAYYGLSMPSEPVRARKRPPEPVTS